jgi:hypothetical protein
VGATDESDWLGRSPIIPHRRQDALREIAATKAWASGEQSGPRRDRSRAHARRGNAAYEKKFGHIFIVCATGKAPLR